MATIIPFRGLRYNPDKVADISQVVTPPYDVIDDAAQALLCQHPANVIRLELGLTYPQDTADNTVIPGLISTWKNGWKKKSYSEPQPSVLI